MKLIFSLLSSSSFLSDYNLDDCSSLSFLCQVLRMIQDHVGEGGGLLFHVISSAVVITRSRSFDQSDLLY